MRAVRDPREGETTAARMERGALDALTRDEAAKATAGDGLPCSACGHPVEPSQQLHTVVLRDLAYGFHVACYSAWVDVDRPPSPVARLS